MEKTKVVLGIDTSNYKTSAAVTDLSGNIISDVRAFLDVKQGERGLRQSDAVFQHVMKLPEILEETLSGRDSFEIAAVAVSTRPRPVDGSYMPCFMSGLSSARAAALALGVPLYEFSHQEGHIKAVSHGTRFDGYDKFLAYHLSGGTFELLKVSKNNPGCGFDIEIIGGTKDISFGQVLDRTGVAMGFGFPCGQEIDRLALACEDMTSVLKGIPVSSLEINLSGIETQAVNAVKSFDESNPDASQEERNAYFAALAHELMTRIASCLIKLTEKAVHETGINAVLFSGGVSESDFIRRTLSDKLTDVNFMFADSGLSSDNAIGIARLGGSAYANKTR